MVGMNFRPLLLGLSIPFAGLVGCAGQQYVTPARMDQGLVIVLTGIEGRSRFNQEICRGLYESGVPYAIELKDWTVGVPGAYLVSLRAQQRNQREAVEIVNRIRRYRISYPERPVYLVGQSGGGAMALWVAERMPYDQQITGVVLLAASISPGYPLDRALYKSDLGIVNFFSRSDWLFLGAGTTLAGTMDGEHGDSAGRVGFRLPEGQQPPEVYDRLYQIAWHEQMASAGHYGGHLSSGAAGFVRQFVAPLLAREQWSDEIISETMIQGWSGRAEP